MYKRRNKVTLIPGDGIGPEVTQAVVRILEATGREIRVGTFRSWSRGLRDSRRVHSRGAV